MTTKPGARAAAGGNRGRGARRAPHARGGPKGRPAQAHGHRDLTEPDTSHDTPTHAPRPATTPTRSPPKSHRMRRRDTRRTSGGRPQNGRRTPQTFATSTDCPHTHRHTQTAHRPNTAGRPTPRDSATHPTRPRGVAPGTLSNGRATRPRPPRQQSPAAPGSRPPRQQSRRAAGNRSVVRLAAASSNLFVGLLFSCGQAVVLKM